MFDHQTVQRKIILKNSYNLPVALAIENWYSNYASISSFIYLTNVKNKSVTKRQEGEEHPAANKKKEG